MVRLDIIEDCHGQGRVISEAGEFIREAEYWLRVLQEVHETRSGETSGLRDIRGWVGLDATDIHLIGQSLTLELEDGRRMDFFYSDSDGTIANRDDRGLYRED